MWGWGEGCWGEGRFNRESFKVVRGFGLRLCRGCLGYREVEERGNEDSMLLAS